MALAAVVLLVVLLFAVVSVRRWLFVRGGGTVECSLRVIPEEGAPGPWRLGIGRYRGDVLHWHRVFGLVVSNRRRPEAGEAAGLPPDASVIEVRDGDLTVELAMSASAMTGFLAWLEAAPPGFPVDIHQSE